MPYTDAAYEPDHSQFPEWHVYRDEDVPDTDPDTATTVKPACGNRLLGTGHLVTVKEHARTAFFDTLTPPNLAEWLGHPSVCEECADEIAEELGIEGELALARSGDP